MAKQERPVIAPPPRKVPLPLAISLVLENFMSIFGCFFFGFGMIFFWIFVCNADLTGFIEFSGKKLVVHGTSLGYDKTGFSEGGSDTSDGTPVYVTEYTFTADNGKQYTSRSYDVGNYYKPDKRVRVEYPPGKPHRSRIIGMRRAPMGPFVLFIVIFPLVGMIFIRLGIKNGRKELFLLANAYPAEAEIADFEVTNMQVNHQSVIKFTFRFEDHDGKEQKSTYKTHKVHALGDEKSELLLYDPYNPAYAVPYDAISDKPLFDAYGNVISPGKLSGLIGSIMYGLSFGGHLAYFLFRYIL